MGKTYRNWSESDSDKRNSRGAKKHSKLKQKEQGMKRMKSKRDDSWNGIDG